MLEVWTLRKGMTIVLPNASSDIHATLADEKFRQGAGLAFEVESIWHRNGLVDVLAFGATMLRLTELDWRAELRVILPHVPDLCFVCTQRFEAAQRAASIQVRVDHEVSEQARRISDGLREQGAAVWYRLPGWDGYA